MIKNVGKKMVEKVLYVFDGGSNKGESGNGQCICDNKSSSSVL